MSTRPEILQSVLETIDSLSGSWEYSGVLSEDTRLVGDLAMKSLDVVVLSSAMVKKYGLIPFDQLYARMEEMPPEETDLTIGEFAGFIHNHLAAVAASSQGAG